MAKYFFIILANAVEGRDAEFNDWYDRQHMPDVLKIPGFVSAQRFGAVPVSGRPAKFGYLTMYEVETDDLEATQAALGAAAGTPAMPMSPSLDSNLVATYFEAAGEKVLAGA